MQEYWVNVYEYKTVKDVQFYSHLINSKCQALYYANDRMNGKCVYRIHVKMKEVKPIKLNNNKSDGDYIKWDLVHLVPGINFEG